MLITSKENNLVKELTKLQNKKYREKNKQFIVEGRHLVMEAFKKGLVDKLLLEQNEIFPLNCETVYFTNDVINKISTLDNPQSIMALCKMPEEDVIDGDKILVIDHIQDPGNLGTIIRSAAAFNIDTIILSEGTVDLYSPKVVRASEGMVFHVNIVKRDLGEALTYLKSKKYNVFGTKVTHGISVKDFSAFGKFAFIIGNEGAGMSEYLEDFCDQFLYIDMNSDCESLNAAVACSIILYQLDK